MAVAGNLQVNNDVNLRCQIPDIRTDVVGDLYKLVAELAAGAFIFGTHRCYVFALASLMSKTMTRLTDFVIEKLLGGDPQHADRIEMIKGAISIVIFIGAYAIAFSLMKPLAIKECIGYLALVVFIQLPLQYLDPVRNLTGF